MLFGALLHGLTLGRAAKPPEVVIDAAMPSGFVLRAAFTEGDPALPITGGNLTAGVPGGAPLTRAVVRITNPFDAPLERLGLTASFIAWFGAPPTVKPSSTGKPGDVTTYDARDVPQTYAPVGLGGAGVDVVAVARRAASPLAWRGRVSVVVDASEGTLIVEAPLRAGEELLDAMSAPTTYAVREVLRNVTYAHDGKRPDPTTRAVSFQVFDAHGAASVMTATLIDIAPVNDPAVLDLNGLHRTGLDFTVEFGEDERNLGVALTDADMFLGDDDGSLILRARIMYEGVFPDGGEAERVELSLKGTSVTGGWNPTTQSLELEGSDTLDAYRRILASARYVNRGRVVDIVDQLPATRELVFTEGPRTFRFEIEDSGGAVASAYATVTVKAMNRKGDATRDENIRTPAECSGFGVRDRLDQLGTGNPETCICNVGHAGDNCEIHPCNYRGTLMYIDGDGVMTCACDLEFSGNTCDVACSGNGELDASSKTCACFPGFTGKLCDVQCPGCDGAHGTCGLTPRSELSWNTGTNRYDIVETTCTCAEWWMGANCTIPCPCAKGGFANGNCVIDTAKQDAGNVPDSELGRCVCDPGWTGADCTIECPPCTAGSGDCVPPKGLEAGIGELLNDILTSSTIGTEEDRARALVEARVTGLCECRMGLTNYRGGVGYTGDACSVPCAPCDKGTCMSDGTCQCFIGYGGPRCDRECSAHGVIVFPKWNATYNDTVFDVLPGVPGNDDTASSGLFDVAQLYPTVPEFKGLNETQAYCACGKMWNQKGDELVPIPDNQIGVNPTGGIGWSGVFCEVPCNPCNAEKGKCEYDGSEGTCACFMDKENGATSESLLVPEGTVGFGYAGPGCEVPCVPCFNGTCSTEPDTLGQCLCNPGYADAACKIECGSPEYVITLKGREYIGSRGTVNLTLAEPGMGLMGTTALCECDYMWTGPMCSHPCPFPWDEEHGKCVIKDPGDSDYGKPWTTEVVCEEGWTGLPPPELRLGPGQLSKGRNCSIPCQTCVHGTCQDDGTCLCDYGYIWQGPLTEESAVGEKIAVSPFPKLSLGEYTYDPAYHNCSARHPCNFNGELFNASCGRHGNGTMDNLTEWRVVDRRGGGGWGCTGLVVNGSVCVGGEMRFAMAYAQWDPFSDEFMRTPGDLVLFKNWGEIQGGYCAAEDEDDLNEGQPLFGGYCVCDSIRNGRFKHPSAVSRLARGYDYYFQGWAGARCEIPCAPCSKNGLCDAMTGKCVCFDGWNGFRCLTPCEPCEHGTCQYDGTCLCHGSRRLIDGTYAVRLTRDPFFLEKGMHTYEVQGSSRTRYVHPVYMNTYDVEDYIWEIEFECPHRAACKSRTYDSHLPTRPNETYFRYTTPNVVEVIKVNEELAQLQAYRDSLVSDVVGVPFTMEDKEECEETDKANVVTKGACLRKMTRREFGRTTQGCGSDWDSVRPWDCDDVIKSHFVRERNLELGTVEVRKMRMAQDVKAENEWFSNNVNERQRLLNTMLRGRFNATTGTFQDIRSPDYYMIWIMHLLINGIPSGDGYTGWNCGVKCDACHPEHGTCQYDGTCECVTGWYGAACDKKCDCFRHVAVKNALELQNLADDVFLESIDSHSGYAIQPHGTCQRDGSCKCYADPDGLMWTGKDCFTKCKPCHHGDCAEDGSCTCHPGWTGETCSVPRFVECMPCDYAHGTCLSDGQCKCDKGYTGLDCSIACSPCVHGDCRMDGSCHCRPGWTLLDCSKKVRVTTAAVRSDFSESSEGWRVHNNSCAGVLDTAVGRGKGSIDAAAAAALVVRGGCDGDFDGGGDGGLEWDGASGYLYLTDRLPNDAPGELAYFRAPGKFLGDKLLSAYNATLSYELYLAGGGDPAGGGSATPAAPHAPGSDPEQSPDVILIGGRPRYRLTTPPWDVWDKHAVFEWSRDHFPELPLNLRWSKERLVATVETYLDTPQVVLSARARRMKHYPPERCDREHCSVNFNFDLNENGGWFNMRAIPAGFGWSTLARTNERNPHVAWTEGTAYVGQKTGAPYDPFDGVSPLDLTRGDGYPSSVPAPDPLRTAGGSQRTRGDGGETAFVWERGDGARVPSRGDNRLAGVLGGLGAFGAEHVAGGDAEVEMRRVTEAMGLLGGSPVGPAGSQGAYPAGTYPGGGGFAGTWWNGEVDNGNDAQSRHVDAKKLLARWDVLPEVYEAINRNRASREGANASFSDMAWCLASLTEILIKADYYGPDMYRRAAASGAGGAMGPGETVRLDHVMISARDPHPSPEHWIDEENEAFMRYIKRYAEDYKVKFLADYFAEYAEALRLSICRGNGVYRNGDAAQGCECEASWRGAECEIPCPACANGLCVLGPTLPNGTGTAVCECSIGWAGPLCDVKCPDCDYAHSSCVTDASGQPSCLCDSGWGGAHCQHACPPCDAAASRCNATTYHGVYPGTSAKCDCVDPVLNTGLLCELGCPGPPDYCGEGRCRHSLEGRIYEETTAAERDGDTSFCECNLGWVGLVCEHPCPGGPNHTTSPGPYPCLGRGGCAVGGFGVAQCTCVSGYIGPACEDTLGVCGDGVINVDRGEECDDGNNLIFDGCDNTCRIEQNWLCVTSPRTDVVAVDGVEPTLVSKCSCPGVYSPILGCLGSGA